MNNTDHIHIFKTNICTSEDKQAIHELLNNETAITEWSVDMDDEDKVLRVVTTVLDQHQIIDMINSRGYLCCELI